MTVSEREEETTHMHALLFNSQRHRVRKHSEVQMGNRHCHTHRGDQVVGADASTILSTTWPLPSASGTPLFVHPCAGSEARAVQCSVSETSSHDKVEPSLPPQLTDAKFWRSGIAFAVVGIALQCSGRGRHTHCSP